MAKSLLDEAVERYAIPRWPYQAAFDRVIVFSVPEERATRETYVEGGLIAKPRNVDEYEKVSSPRGVLVSAGVGAHDVLRSHFMGLGHMLWVARLAPWRHEVERDKNGLPIEFLFLRVGDIVGSENLKQWLAEGRVSIRADADGVHHYHTEEDGLRPRFDPPSYVA